jgi:hypothetical protein
MNLRSLLLCNDEKGVLCGSVLGSPMEEGECGSRARHPHSASAVAEVLVTAGEPRYSNTLHALKSKTNVYANHSCNVLAGGAETEHSWLELSRKAPCGNADMKLTRSLVVAAQIVRSNRK